MSKTGMTNNGDNNEWKYSCGISYNTYSDNGHEIINNEEAETLLGDLGFQNSQISAPTIINVGSISNRGSAQSVFTGNLTKSILPPSLSSSVAPSRPFNSSLPPGSNILQCT